MPTKTNTPKDPETKTEISHPGMMGDGTEEQNLDERGNPAARITKKDAKRAFGKPRPAK